MRDNDIHIPGPLQKIDISEELIHRFGWKPRDANRWVRQTGETANDIEAWSDHGFSSEQARRVIAIGGQFKSARWRELEIPAAVVVDYVDAGFSVEEAEKFERQDARPSPGELGSLGGLSKELNDKTEADWMERVRNTTGSI